MPPSSLLDLPAELIIHVISHLPYTSVFACAATNRLLHTLIGTSTKLQYYLTAQIAGVHPSPPTSRHGELLPLSSRLASLQQRESGWSALQFTGITEIPLTFSPSGMYALSSGVIVLGEAAPNPWGPRWPTIAIQYVRLPSAPTSTDSEDVCWTRIDAQGDQILDVAMNVPEWDLIAILSRRKDGGDLDRSFRVHLLQLSTGVPHPLAVNPILYLNFDGSDGGTMQVQLDVVGRRLVVLTGIMASLPPRKQSLYVFDWMSGRLAVTMDSMERTYICFSFLTNDTVVLLNLHKKSLDVFRLPGSNVHTLETFTPYLRLFLPAFTPNAQIVNGFCRGEPNPTASSSTSNQSQDSDPYPSRADDAIMIFSLIISGWNAFPERAIPSLVFFVHRRALRELADEHALHAERDSHMVEVEWVKWGPPRTRWFTSSEGPSEWITTTCGQRYVTVPDNGDLVIYEPITLFDFNEANVRRAQWKEEELDRRDLAESKQVKKWRQVVTEATKIELDIFSETVWNALPYVQIKSAIEHTYDGVLMDEGRVIGMKMLHAEGIVIQVDVMHVG